MKDDTDKTLFRATLDLNDARKPLDSIATSLNLILWMVFWLFCALMLRGCDTDRLTAQVTRIADAVGQYQMSTGTVPERSIHE